MKHHFKLVSLIVCIALQHADSLEAAVIYSQTMPEEPVGAFSSQDTTSGQIIADNFLLDGSTAVVVRSVRLQGARTGSMISLTSENFRVVFFENDNGLPGAVVPGGDFSGDRFVSRSATGGQLLNGRNIPYEYRIDLGDGGAIVESRVLE